MTRRSLSNILSNEERGLQDVWAWYEFQRTLIGEEKSRVLDVLASGGSPAAFRYFGKTRQELEDDFTKQTAELWQLTSLGMLASTEAVLRIDFIVRCGATGKRIVYPGSFGRSAKIGGSKTYDLKKISWTFGKITVLLPASAAQSRNSREC